MKLVKEAPVFIVSSVRRSGTTLLQRLLCSSSNSLIYGENCANDINLFCNLISTKQSVFQTSKDWYDNQLDAVLQGNVNTWIPDLMPDIEGYLAAYKTGMLSIINYYSDYALKQNRPIWGMKLPEWNPCMLAMLKSVLPEIKIIYLHRNLEDCVRSAKKIEMVINQQEVQRFCTTWKHYTDFANLHLKGTQVMHLDYEDLVSEPAIWIAKIEAFTGAKEIDRAVIQTKINTYESDERISQKNTGKAYLEPAELTEEELSLVHSFSKKTKHT